MNEVKVGCEATWLLNGKAGRSAMGTVEEISTGAKDVRVVLRITSVERRADEKKIGARWSVPCWYLQANS